MLRGPAGAASGWDAMTAYATLGTMVDAPVNQWGVVPVFVRGKTTGRMPDAVAVGQAVARLADCAFEAPSELRSARRSRGDGRGDDGRRAGGLP